MDKSFSPMTFIIVNSAYFRLKLKLLTVPAISKDAALSGILEAYKGELVEELKRLGFPTENLLHGNADPNLHRYSIHYKSVLDAESDFVKQYKFDPEWFKAQLKKGSEIELVSYFISMALYELENHTISWDYVSFLHKLYDPSFRSVRPDIWRLVTTFKRDSYTFKPVTRIELMKKFRK